MVSLLSNCTPTVHPRTGSVPRSFRDGGGQNIGGIVTGGGGGSMLTRDNVGIMGTSVGRLSSNSYTDPNAFVGTVGGIGARLSPQIGVSSSEDDFMDNEVDGMENMASKKTYQKMRRYKINTQKAAKPDVVKRRWWVGACVSSLEEDRPCVR